MFLKMHNSLIATKLRHVGSFSVKTFAISAIAVTRYIFVDVPKCSANLIKLPLQAFGGGIAPASFGF